MALSLARIVNVQIIRSPLAIARRGFGIHMLVSNSDVIDPNERLRTYVDIDSIAADFGVDSNVYIAAGLYFSQRPRPTVLMVGRWVDEPAPAYLKGGVLTPEEQDMANWESITSGELFFTINGDPVEVGNLDFSGTTNLNGVASVIATGLSSHGATVAWNGQQFVVSTLTTGAGNTISFAEDTTSLAARMKLTANTGLPLIPGAAAETPLQAVTVLADKSALWYGCAFTEEIRDEDHLAVAGFIESTLKARVYFLTTTDTRALESVVSNDIMSRLKALGYDRSFSQYSANPQAVNSAAARGLIVNFNANNSTITLKFKTAPGVVAADLTESQARALAAKNGNVYAQYEKDIAIIQEGVMASGAFFDEIHGLDWLQDAVQTEYCNVLYQSTTKIPQTDDGMNRLVTAVSGVLDEAVNNGLIAPGVWNADPIGQLKTGDYLPTGYYIYFQSVDDQPQSEREQRKATVMQCAIKLAGAIHSGDVIINVNR